MDTFLVKEHNCTAALSHSRTMHSIKERHNQTATSLPNYSNAVEEAAIQERPQHNSCSCTPSETIIPMPAKEGCSRSDPQDKEASVVMYRTEACTKEGISCGNGVLRYASGMTGLKQYSAIKSVM
jgi:hypothetical protein